MFNSMWSYSVVWCAAWMVACHPVKEVKDAPPVVAPPVVAPAAAAAASEPSACWVGKLSRNIPFDDAVPSRYCLEDSTLWEGAPYRLGRRNLVGLVDVPKELEGEVVLVRGTPGASMLDVLTPMGPCPAEGSTSRQFRSDWTADEGGYATTRAKMRAVPYIRAATIEPFAVLEIEGPFAKEPRKPSCESTPGAPLVLTLHNPSNRPWRVDVLLHYEGGRGKPMPKYERRSMAVEPGQDGRLEVPAAIEELEGDRGRACFNFESAELLGAVGECEALTAYKLD